MLGHTVRERLYKHLTDDYEDEVDPGIIDLQMSVVLLCAWVDQDTGFINIRAWESYVRIQFSSVYSYISRSDVCSPSSSVV